MIKLPREYHQPHLGVMASGFSGFASGTWDWEDDLSASTNWTITGNNAYDGTYDEIDYTTPNASASGWAFADPMGAVVSDTSWVGLMEISMDSLQASDGCGMSYIWFGMSDQASRVSNATQDALGFELRANNAVTVAVNGTNVFATSGIGFATTITAKKYWYVPIRESATLFSNYLYPDATLTTADYSAVSVTVSSSIINLRYMYNACKANHVGVCPVGTTNGSLEAVKFADGVTVPP